MKTNSFPHQNLIYVCKIHMREMWKFSVIFAAFISNIQVQIHDAFLRIVVPTHPDISRIKEILSPKNASYGFSFMIMFKQL